MSELDQQEKDAPAGRLRAFLASAVVLFLLAAAVVFVQSQHETGSAPPVPTGGGITQGPTTHLVQVMKLQRREIARTLTLPANISPWYRATLYAKVSGYLKWIGFDKGDQVKKGQLLARIDAPEVQDDLEQAQADYAIKRLTYDRLLAVWKENPDVIARQDVDVAQAAAEGAKQVMEHRRTLLQYTKVTAPFSGVITARFADPGAMIQAATGSATQATPLFTLMDVDPVRIYVSVPQESSVLARPGVPARLSVKELPGQEFTGTVTRTTESLDPATRTLLVEIDLPNKDHRLQTGMYVTATLELERHNNALTVPPAAIDAGSGTAGKAVFAVENGKVRRVPIKTGIDDGTWVEVTEGLTGDESIVVVGKSGLQDGQDVTATSYDLPAGKPASQKY